MIVTDLGVSLRFGVTQFQKTSGQQSNGNGYRQNNYGGGYQQPNNGYQQGAYNNYQQQGYSQQAPAQTPAQPAAPSQPAMDPWLRPRQPARIRTATAPTRNSKRFRH